MPNLLTDPLRFVFTILLSTRANDTPKTVGSPLQRKIRDTLQVFLRQAKQEGRGE